MPSSSPWLVKTLEVLFWTYAATVFQYHVIFNCEQLPVTEAMPAWILPVYRFLILGVLGSTLLKSQPLDTGLLIFIGSITFSDLGLTVAFFMLTIYVTRLVNSDLPEAPKMPGMFVAVGPAAYTANTFVALGMQAPKHIPDDFLGITWMLVGDIFKAFGVTAGILLWLVAFWFCALTTVSVLVSAKESHFTLNYCAFIFPNAGLIVALIRIATALNSNSIKGVCSGATIILIITWFFVAISNIRGLVKKQVLWPGKDEDMEDVEGQQDNLSEEEDNSRGRQNNSDV